MEQNIFEELDTLNVSDAKRLLLEHLIERVEYQSTHETESRDIAYALAGLMATTFIASLPKDDPYVEILSLAGELELPERHRSDATWEELRNRVNMLAVQERNK
jgi:hypothetical protein